MASNSKNLKFKVAGPARLWSCHEQHSRVRQSQILIHLRMDIVDALESQGDEYLKERFLAALACVRRTLDLFGYFFCRQKLVNSLRQVQRAFIELLYALQTRRCCFQLQRRQRLYGALAYPPRSYCFQNRQRNSQQWGSLKSRQVAS